MSKKVFSGIVAPIWLTLVLAANISGWLALSYSFKFAGQGTESGIKPLKKFSP